MSKRPRLLFLSQNVPYPPDGGVKIRTYNILRLLAREFDVRTLCFHRIKGGGASVDVTSRLAALPGLTGAPAFSIPQELSRMRLLWDHGLSVLSGRVYTAYAYESRSYRARLKELLDADSIDIVHVDSLDLSGYLRELSNLPVVCTHHNIESSLLRKRASMEQAWWRRRYVLYQSTLMEREERRWCGDVAANVVVSQVDGERLRELVPHARIVVVPNGVDTDFFRPTESDGNAIVTVGGTSWFPNMDGLEFFAHEVLPLIRHRGVSSPVRWIGDATPGQVRQYAAHGIELTGYVDDVRPHVAEGACFIVPLRVGGGTRLKILDAWAMGKAVVSTSIGCEGLTAEHRHNILIADTARDFADCTCEVLRNASLRQSLGNAGRRTVEESYSWDAIGSAMNEFYAELIP
jgi:glycosyltransferase involved in cell wall biosynthesis